MRCWWLMFVILDTWDAEIRRIMVLGKPRQKKFVRSHCVSHACHPVSLGKKQDTITKTTRAKGAEGMA
jgi:hypothetical protein